MLFRSAMVPVSPYGASKRAAELLAQTYRSLTPMGITILRLFTVYGPRQRPEMAIHQFTRLIMSGQPVPLFGDGKMARDYTFVSDIVDGITASLSLTSGIDVLNLGGAHPVQLLELVSTIAEACGREAKIEYKPEQAGDVQATCADVQRAAERIGYRPRVALKEGIGRFVEWYREKGTR